MGVFAADHIMLSYCLGLSYSGRACNRLSCSRQHACIRSHYVVILPGVVLQWLCMQQITLCCHTAQGGLVEGMCAADHIMFSYCQSDWGRVVTDMF